MILSACGRFVAPYDVVINRRIYLFLSIHSLSILSEHRVHRISDRCLLPCTWLWHFFPHSTSCFFCIPFFSDMALLRGILCVFCLFFGGHFLSSH